MHIVSFQACALPMCSSSSQWRSCEAKLGKTGIQTCKDRRSSSRPSMDRDQAPPPPPPPTDDPPQEAQQQAPVQEQQPMCAAAAMMHGLPSNMRPSISRQSTACPPIHEKREWIPQAQEEQPQYPQPGYRVPANTWTSTLRIVPINGIFLAPCCDSAVSGESKLANFEGKLRLRMLQSTSATSRSSNSSWTL